MSLVAVACTCNSSESLVRKHLRLNNCADFLRVPVVRGKDKSLSLLTTLPQHEKLHDLRRYIEANSKFAIIIGYNDTQMGWADVASADPKHLIEVGVIVEHFQ